MTNDINIRLHKFSKFYRRGASSRVREERSLQHQKLLRDAERLQKEFQRVIKSTLAEEKRYLARNSSRRQPSFTDDDDDLEDDDEGGFVQTQELENELVLFCFGRGFALLRFARIGFRFLFYPFLGN